MDEDGEAKDMSLVSGWGQLTILQLLTSNTYVSIRGVNDGVSDSDARKPGNHDNIPGRSLLHVLFEVNAINGM